MAKFTAEQLLNHLYNKRLPRVYREADKDTKYCLKRFLQSMIEGGFTEALTSADGIVDLTDPLKCPDSIFPYLFKSFGYTYSADIPMTYQRKILYNHGELYQKRGSIEYIYILTRILTGFDCEVTTERVNGVRVLTIKMFVDNSVTAVEQQHYVNLVKRFVTEGYIPFYLDVETNIVVDVVDVFTAQQYMSSAVGVEGNVEVSPIIEITKRGLVESISPTLENEPFSAFNILGYSSIVPRYYRPNTLNPNVVEYDATVKWVDSSGGTTTLSSVDLFTDFMYIPYGNKLYINLANPTYAPPTVYILVYTLNKVFVDEVTLTGTKFIKGKAVADLSSILLSNKLGEDYYVRIALRDNQGVSQSDLPKLISVWFEDAEYSSFSAGTRFKFDNEYYRNGEAFPTYTVDVFDANGPISFPYCMDKNVSVYTAPQTGALALTDKGNDNFTAYVDCTTAIKDDTYYCIQFKFFKSASNMDYQPILTALCSNRKGTFKDIILEKTYEAETNEDWQQFIYRYQFKVPKDFVVVNIKFALGSAKRFNGTVTLSQVQCFEVNPKTMQPIIEADYQPYVLSGDLNVFKNNLTVGIDGIQLLSYNDSNGKVIVRDSYDVITGILTRRVGVNYDSLGHPVSVYKLSSPITEKVTEDYNGEVKPIPISTFAGKTYVSMSQSTPHSFYENSGGSEYHSCFEFTTKIIE